MGHTALHNNPRGWYLAEFKGVIWLRINGFGQVFAHLVFININGGHKVDIADMVPTKVHVH